MIKNLIDNLKNLDKKNYKILIYGLRFCFTLCIISCIILITYNITFTSPFLYYIGISLFRLSIIFGIEFIICSLITDKIKKQMI